MLRIEALEQGQGPNDHIQIGETVKRWGEYLDYLNTFYLFLDSSTIEIAKLSYFNLHEITNRDAFRVRYEGGKCVGENIAIEKRRVDISDGTIFIELSYRCANRV